MRSPEEWETLWLRDYRRFPVKVMPDKIKTFVKEIQSDAIQSEREACAKIVESFEGQEGMITIYNITDAIRSRNEKER